MEYHFALPMVVCDQPLNQHRLARAPRDAWLTMVWQEKRAWPVGLWQWFLTLAELCNYLGALKTPDAQYPRSGCSFDGSGVWPRIWEVSEIPC